MRNKDSQYYSKIALKWIIENAEYWKTTELEYVTYGNLNQMEDLYDLFGGDRSIINKFNSIGQYQQYRFRYVLDKLDRESKKPDAIFTKIYINYPGIINARTRGFKLKESNYVYCRECKHLVKQSEASFNVIQGNFICDNCHKKVMKGVYGI